MLTIYVVRLWSAIAITISFIATVQPFSVSTIRPVYHVSSIQQQRPRQIMVSYQTSDSTSEIDSKQKQQQLQEQTPQYKIPLTWDEMVRQVASCSKQASNAGANKQIVRILLPRDSTSGDFGKYLENNMNTVGTNDSTNNNQGDIKLVPPDESWQGGIMQLYRSASPTAIEIVRMIQLNTITTTQQGVGMPARINEDRSVDESGVDGVGIISTDDNSIICWVQPTQENVNEFINTASSIKSNQIAMLLNPQWRQVDDALDTASQNNNNPFLQGLANFLGGKGAVIQRCADVGYIPIYSLEGYVCKGTNVRLIQTYMSDWYVYAERDDLETYTLVGSYPTRPTYQIVEDMMTKSDIGYKYARDIGLQPKF